MPRFSIYLDKDQKFKFTGPDFNVGTKASQYLYFFSYNEPKKPREMFHVKVMLPNGEIWEKEKPQKDWLVDTKYHFKINGLHTIEMRLNEASESFNVNVIGGTDHVPAAPPNPVDEPIASGKPAFSLPPPFEGAVPVPCSDPGSIYQDVSGQCWATPAKGRKRLDLSISAFLPGAVQKLQENTFADEIFSTVFNFLPIGWTIEEIKVRGSVLSVTLIEEGSPAVLAAIAPIVAALQPLLIVVGIIVLSWKLVDLKTAKEETKQQVKQSEVAAIIESNKDNLIGRISELREDNLITENQAASLINRILLGDVDSLLGAGLGTGEQNTLIIIAAIAAAALLAFALISKK